MRERDERDARFFAWDVPGDAHIVALVHEAGEAERSATVADAIATSIARRREHTLLLSAEPGPSPLDELLGAVASEGLPAALEGRARLTDVAIQRVDRPFVYLPGGSDAAAMRSLLADRVLASFVERVRERGGTLFIVLTEETLRGESVRALVDGYVALGDVALPDGEGGLTQFGRVRFDNGGESEPHSTNGGNPLAGIDLPELPPAPVPGAAVEAEEPEADGSPDIDAEPGAPGAAAAESGAEEPASAGEPAAAEPPRATPAAAEPAAAETVADAPAAPDEPEDTPAHEGAGESWSRHRQTSGFPSGRVAIAAAGVLGIVVAWWLIAGALGGGETAGDGAGSGHSAAQATPAVAAPAPAFDEEAGRAAFADAPELGFSVMIASFAVKADADERVARLRTAGDGFYFISPTPVRGIVYHRVFAGALATRGEAQSLMEALVASGVKDEAGAWHLRPSDVAYDLGVYPDAGAAGARVDELASAGIPAYRLRSSADADAAWRVYGGAYVDEREAAPMGELLSAAGEPTELVTRVGVLPPETPF